MNSVKKVQQNSIFNWKHRSRKHGLDFKQTGGKFKTKLGKPFLIRLVDAWNSIVS